MSGKKEKVGLDYRRVFCKTVKEETMLGKVRTAAIVAAMMAAGMGLSTAFGGEFNVDLSRDTILSSGAVLDSGASRWTLQYDDVYVHATEDDSPKIDDLNIIVDANKSLTFGIKYDNGAEINSKEKVDYTLAAPDSFRGTFDIRNGTVFLKAGGNNGQYGTLVNVKDLKLNSTDALISIEASAGATGGSVNTLSANTVTNGSFGTLKVGQNSLFQVTGNQVATLGTATNAFNINLDGGRVNFKGTRSNDTGSMTLTNGTISGSGQVDGDITLSTTDASIRIAGAMQNYTGNVLSKGNIVIGGVDETDSEMNVAGNLQLSDAGRNSIIGDEDGKATLNVAKTFSAKDLTNTVEISGAERNLGTVAAANIDFQNSDMEVGEYGLLEIGKDGNKNANLWKDGMLTVKEDGTAVFYNTVAVNNGSVIADGGDINFKAQVDLTNGAGISTEQDGEIVFDKKVTMKDMNTTIFADSGTVRFLDSVEMDKDSVLGMSDNGIIDYSKVNGNLNLDKGRLVSEGDDATMVSNSFLTGSNKLIGSQKGAVTIDGSSLTLYANEPDTNSYGDYQANANESIDFDQDGGNFTVSNLTVTKNVNGNIFVVPENKGLMTVKKDFTVDVNANAYGDANVDMTVEGKSYINGAYYMAGDSKTSNVFDGNVTVSGKQAVLGVKNNGNKTATMMMGDRTEIAIKSGATLGNDGKTLTILGEDDIGPAIKFNGDGTANKIVGNVIASTSATSVLTDLNVDGNYTTLTYTQNGGAVSGKNSSKITVLSEDNAAIISGSDSIFGMHGDFAGDLRVQNGATLLGNGNTIKSTTDEKSLYVDANSKIDLSTNDLTVTGYKTIDVDGALKVGYGSDRPNSLTTDSDARVNIDLQKNLSFTTDFFQKYYNNGNPVDKHIINNGQINEGIEDSWTKNTAFGDYSITVNDESMGMGAYIDAYTARDVTDLNDIKDYLGTVYDSRTVTEGFANYISGTAMNILDPAKGLSFLDTPSGNANQSILQAIARGDSTWDFNGVTRELGKDYAYVNNGSTLFGVTDVAKDSIRNVQDAITSRLDAFRAVRECVINECYASGTALGSANILNDRYMNRIWAGALGNWQNADHKKGFDGYKYKAGGGIIGYDRAFGAAIIGASFAFIDGDYEDKTFSRNDSKIRQYNGNIYANYNASSGFFFNLMGGYNYADNKLSYGLGDSDWKEKFHTQTWYATGKIGYDIMPCDNFSITPSIGVNYFYTRTNGHNARMTTVDADLTRIGRATDHLIEMPVQVQVAYEIPVGEKGGLTLMADGGYTYNFRNKGLKGYTNLVDANALNGFDLTGTRIHGRSQGRHTWNAGAGVKFRYDRWEIGAKYDYIGRSKYNSHQVTGTVGYSF